MAIPMDEALASRLYRQAGADRWQVSQDQFRAALEASAAKAFSGVTPAPRDLERYLSSLRLAELALACACAAGHEAAWEHFILEYRPVLYRAADALDASGGARELADSLYADLFGLRVDTPDTPAVSGFSRTDNRAGDRRSLFRYFHGRSSLATWLRSVLSQRLVDRARARARTAPLPDEEPAAPPQPPSDPHRDRYLSLVHAAFRDALARLDPRDRLRLLYYYAQGLTLAQTGRLLREHEASVSRRLSSARKAIRRDVEQQLRDSAALSPDEIERCFAYVSEDPGPLDLDRLLDNSAGPAAGENRALAAEALAKSARNVKPDVQRENREEGILQSPSGEGLRGPVKR
jgi:RNA polymerase sigma-70 factor (ECF subfamily)